MMATNSIMKNTNRVFTDTIRNTSCSNGWLKQLNQILFGTITVLLFALLMLVVLNEALDNHRTQDCPDCRPCLVSHCTVMCSDNALQLSIDDQLAIILKDVDDGCHGRGISVILNNPIFKGGQLPRAWLAEHNLNISTLVISGGNLRDVNNVAFLSSSFEDLQSLTFEAVTIARLTVETFLGLSHLREMNIRNSVILDLQENAMRPLKKTLRTLQIKGSGSFDPSNFTGSFFLGNLTIVDMTQNDFQNKLNKESFQGLSSCRILYLSSSKITAIGEGAFDYLENVNRIDLNDNLLKTLPERLFDRVIAQNTDLDLRINLHNNPWHCDCQLESVRMLYQTNSIMVDPLCHSPDYFKNRLFSSVESFCTEVGGSTLTHTSRKKLESTAVESLQISDMVTLDYNSPELHDNSTFIESVESETSTINSITSPSELLAVSLPYINTLCAEEDRLSNLSLRCESNSSDDESFSLDMLLYHQNDNSSTTNATSGITFWEHLFVNLKTNSNDNNVEIVWFNTFCPKEIYCIGSYLHRLLAATEENMNVYCAVDRQSKIIKAENCVTFVAIFLDHENTSERILTAGIYAASILSCIILSSFLVFVIVRKHPTLLKGSKRVLLVQHRAAQALVLPAKFSVKNNMVRRDSVQSVVSGTPSYISALQPTEDQLANWRISRLPLCEPNKVSITSIDYHQNLSYTREKGEFDALNYECNI